MVSRFGGVGKVFLVHWFISSFGIGSGEESVFAPAERYVYRG